ncbi:hypothetical protein [Arthrobacter oryzae]|uniref:hypothetical protein n=1 Tax=Arthrobacter oryzae TaxID=409290 RepID=UPI00278812CB|nr:hypothetical protein [Arthrobacter oryzae]MDQ0078230.1 hypothetical protein [Arthrobacter oryzae]
MEPEKRPPSNIVTYLLWAGSGILIFTAIILQTLNWNAGSEDKTSDWISAFGTAGGAVITGGAALIAALTYQHQVEEKIRAAANKRRADFDARRAQAKSVTVSIIEKPDAPKTMQIRVANGSSQAINSVFLVLVDKQRKEPFQKPYYLIPPGTEQGFDRDERIVGAAYANFTDANGVRWRSWFNGDLEER